MTVGDDHRSERRSNVRLAVVLAIVAVMFYFSIFVLTDS